MSSSSKTPAFSAQFQSILDAALSEYQKKTGNDLSDSGLAKEMQSCQSAEDVLKTIQDQAEAFDKFRNSDKRLMKWICSSVDVLYTISSTLGAGVSIVRTIRDDPRCVVTSFCSRFLPPMQSLSELVSSSLFVHLCSFLSTLLTLIFCRLRRMSGRATMCSPTSSSAFNSSSNALGFILGFHRPRIWWIYS
jgi:hypothetical protein